MIFLQVKLVNRGKLLSKTKNFLFVVFDFLGICNLLVYIKKS